MDIEPKDVTKNTIDGIESSSLAVIDKELLDERETKTLTMIEDRRLPGFVKEITIMRSDSSDEILSKLGFTSNESREELNRNRYSKQLLKEVERYRSAFFRSSSDSVTIPYEGRNYSEYLTALKISKKSSKKMSGLIEALIQYLSNLMSDLTGDRYDFIEFKAQRVNTPIKLQVIAIVGQLICLLLSSLLLDSKLAIFFVSSAVVIGGILLIRGLSHRRAVRIKKSILSTSYNGLMVKAVQNSVDISQLEELKEPMEKFPKINDVDFLLKEEELLPILEEASILEDEFIAAIAKKENFAEDDLVKGYADRVRKNSSQLQEVLS